MSTPAHMPSNQQAADLEREVQVLRDVVYGRAGVGFTRPGGPVDRALKMDVYLPLQDARAPTLRPMLVMAFGGAFHRGSKENDAFESEAGNTSVADYCRRFAERGYVACSIDYRLVPEDPAPGGTPVIGDPKRIPRSRVDVVRNIMGLAPATSDMLWRGIEAASDDMAAAVRFARQQAAEWNADPSRLAVGGFSAGARTALNAAFGEGIDVAAVVALSGFMDTGDLKRMLAPDRAVGEPETAVTARRPAVLWVSAEHDLDYIVAATPASVQLLRDSGVRCDRVDVPGAGHFYRAEARAIAADGMATTVDRSVDEFLKEVLRADAPAA
ncbi:MAG: alpha/beta hydrolase [Gammaproteobacteria bacterium]|nr:alpha/beta hydrolase [Gammaproteobacteria bacterium]